MPHLQCAFITSVILVMPCINGFHTVWRVGISELEVFVGML